MPDITQFGVGLVAVVIILREVFGFLKDKKSHGDYTVKLPDRYLEHFDIICGRIGALYEWHQVTDRNGNKIWYNNTDLADAIKELTIMISKQSLLLDRITTRLIASEQEHTRIIDKLNKIAS